MHTKLMFYGISSIIGITVSIAALGSVQHMLSQTMQDMFGTDITNRTSLIVNTYCNIATDCKQDSKDCTRCVNIMQGGFTLISKCSENKIPCECINNICTAKN